MNRSDIIYNYVLKKIHILNPQQRAVLRANASRPLGSDPKVFEILFKDMPEELIASPISQKAIYYALTLYAIHQQGDAYREKSAQKENVNLGLAMARLLESPDKKDSLIRTFSQVTSGNIDGVATKLRGVVNRMHQKNICMDYAKLAKDFYFFQLPKSVNQVRIFWGQTFYKTINKQGGNIE